MSVTATLSAAEQVAKDGVEVMVYAGVAPILVKCLGRPAAWR